MTVGRRQYNEAEMMQMQREAEARVRDMQQQARQTVEQANAETDAAPSARTNRNWSSHTGMSRQRPMRWPGPGMNRMPSSRTNRRNTSSRQTRTEDRDNPDEHDNRQHPDTEPSEQRRNDTPPHPPAPPETPAERPAPKKDGTIIGDIMGALNIDEDYLLIVGLILILINQRADTTLILALAYLLF